MDPGNLCLPEPLSRRCKLKSNCFSLSHIPLNSMLEINSICTILITQRHTNILGFSESCISIMPSSPLHVKILTWLEVPSPHARSRCSIRQVMLCHLVPGGTETWHQIDAIWNNMMLYEMNIDILQMRKWYLYFIGFYWWPYLSIDLCICCLYKYIYYRQAKRDRGSLGCAGCLPWWGFVGKSVSRTRFTIKFKKKTLKNMESTCHNEHTNSIF